MFGRKQYSGLAIADYFIKKALQRGETITNMHVLKIIYFVQGFGFPELNRRIIKDDFYAWQWGPVEVKTYETFCIYRDRPIQYLSGFTNDELREIEKDIVLCNFLDKFYRLREINPFVLSEKTHDPAGPWAKTIAYSVIDIKTIENYFRNYGQQ